MEFTRDRTLLVFLFYTLSIASDCFTYPPINNNLTLFSSITATSTCSSDIGSDTCSSTCPGRTSYPRLQSPTTNCTGSNLPDDVNEAIDENNGYITFSANDTCQPWNDTMTPGIDDSYTFSFWMRSNCSNCEILRNWHGDFSFNFLNNNLNITFSSLSKSFTTNFTIFQLVVIRFDGQGGLDLFVGDYHEQYTGVKINSYEMTFGSNIMDSGVLELADMRWYEEALTYREIEALSNKGNTLSSLAVQTDCRCPVEAPKVNEMFQHLCEGNNTLVSRLNAISRIAIYMVDDDNDTAWYSDQVESATVTLTLKSLVQVRSCTLESLMPSTITSLTITFHRNSTQTGSWVFSNDCHGNSQCNNLSDVFSGNTFAFMIETDTTPSRSEYETLLADSVTIQVTNDIPTVFKISEVVLEARCPCYGADDDCTIISGEFICSCDQSTNTISDSCEMCQQAFYRQGDDFFCSNRCDCNVNGSTHNVCDQVGGQCPCKPNVDPTEGKLCDTCKFNTANLGSDPDNGCQQCSCDTEGMIKCSDGPNGGICECKANLKTDPADCSICEVNFYNKSHETGCQPCDCDVEGTREADVGDCNKNTGACTCIANVEGRTCDECIDTYYAFPGCIECNCDDTGSNNSVCNKTTGQCPCGGDSSSRECKTEITKISPNYGPIAGGTRVTIKGENLRSSRIKDITVYIGNIEHKVDVWNPSELIFTTNNSNTVMSSKITISVTTTKNVDFRTEKTFDYRDNPTLKNTYSLIVPTYSGGGCTIKVLGEQVNNVAGPKIIIYTTNTSTIAECTSSRKELVCKTPDLSAFTKQSPIGFGFILDNVTGYRRMGELTIVNDPEIVPGSADFLNTFDTSFEIEGNRLAAAGLDEDVSVELDGTPCAKISRQANKLICEPNDPFPGKTKDVNVTVTIGNYHAVWGILKMKVFWQTLYFYLIATGAGIVLVAIIVLVCCCICRRRKFDGSGMDRERQERRSNSYIDLQNIPPSTDNDTVVPINHVPAKIEAPPNYVDEFCARLDHTVGKVVSSSLINKSDIQVGNVCTKKGTNVRIINGQFKDSASVSRCGTDLTIKTLIKPYIKEGSLPEWLLKGIQESTFFQNFNNNNILRMHGIVIDSQYIYILYPEMDKRTLKVFLITCRAKDVEEAFRLNLCVQIAEGMNYLDSNGVVHKDLACRNCWMTSGPPSANPLDDEIVVKISDASFSPDLYPEEYMNLHERCLPVRWMAPESLKQGFYTTKTDAWAFGVTMWEIFTDGYLPYHDCGNEDVVKEVQNGELRLASPDGFHKINFSIMRDCFKTKFADRPTFNTIVTALGNINSPTASSNVAYRNKPQHYVNKGFNAPGDTFELDDYENWTADKKKSEPIPLAQETYENYEKNATKTDSNLEADELYINTDMKPPKRPPRPF